MGLDGSIAQFDPQDLSETARVHLLYTKFQGIATPLSPLILELERRAKLGDSQALLDECHTAYCGARRSLMTPKVMNDIRGLDPTRSELVDLVSFPMMCEVRLQTKMLCRHGRDVVI
jgi:hypothetical protein